MSFLNGLSALGSGLKAAGEDIATQQEQDAQATARASLLNNAPPPTAAPTTAAAPAATAPVDTKADIANHGNALDAATVARAHQVYLGLTARGMDPTTAIGFAANAVQESRANPGTSAGDMGASHGLLQWRGDRLTNYVAKFGHPPEQGDLNEQLDFIGHELGGSEANAWKAIQAAPADPAARAAAVSQYFERPKDTQAEIQRRGWIAAQLADRFSQMTAPGAS